MKIFLPKKVAIHPIVCSTFIKCLIEKPKEIEALCEQKHGVDNEIKNRDILNLHFDGTFKINPFSKLSKL